MFFQSKSNSQSSNYNKEERRPPDHNFSEQKEENKGETSFEVSKKLFFNFTLILYKLIFL